MNEADCNALEEAYRQAREDNEQRRLDSIARQQSLKEDAFVLNGLEGESFEDFQARVKDAFNTYVPIPIDPEVPYMQTPPTC